MQKDRTCWRCTDKMEEAVKPTTNGGRKRAALTVFLILAIIGAVSVFYYLRYKAVHISTDDAFIDGDIHTIASKVPGTVRAVLVKSNQSVKEGDALVEIDPADYDLKVKEAEAALAAERGKLAETESRVEASKRRLAELRASLDSLRALKELHEANLDQAEKDMRRAESLIQGEAISRERYEKTVTGYKVALAQVKASGEGIKNAEAAIETQKAVVRQAEAARTPQLSSAMQKEAVLETARLNHGYTKIMAPADGFVTKKSVEVGNQVQPGQPIMAVVRLDDISVTANYKETQLEKIRPGQKVEIKVDSYPGKVFTGKVDSIMAGTGATFSLFPPENATGNYVKVVQRVPIKIVLDKDTDPGHVLRVGMSVVPTVLVGR